MLCNFVNDPPAPCPSLLSMCVPKATSLSPLSRRVASHLSVSRFTIGLHLYALSGMFMFSYVHTSRGMRHDGESYVGLMSPIRRLPQRPYIAAPPSPPPLSPPLLQ